MLNKRWTRRQSGSGCNNRWLDVCGRPRAPPNASNLNLTQEFFAWFLKMNRRFIVQISPSKEPSLLQLPAYKLELCRPEAKPAILIHYTNVVRAPRAVLVCTYMLKTASCHDIPRAWIAAFYPAHLSHASRRFPCSCLKWCTAAPFTSSSTPHAQRVHNLISTKATRGLSAHTLLATSRWKLSIEVARSELEV